ncbi:MAG: formyltransferase family protein [Alcanivoracaceae bacterium]
MRTILICHADDLLTRESMSRWLASFSELAGIVIIHEPRARMKKRIAREIERIGRWRFLDVIAWRLYSRLFLAHRERRWQQHILARLSQRFAPAPVGTPVLNVESPNSDSCREFIAAARPDMIIARCKTLLRKEIFALPAHGTWVMHPGICPEYRNAHGCFWALASNDDSNVGMTLLRIDEGIDTGPVYGYFRYSIDPLRDTPTMINHQVVLENLDALRDRLVDIIAGNASPIDTRGRASAEWGQPWLSRYLRWQWRVRRQQ